MKIQKHSGLQKKKFWARIEPVLLKVFEEIKQNGLIETVFTQRKVDGLRSCINKQDDFSKISNAFIGLFKSRENAEEFTKLNSRFGIDAETLAAASMMTWLTLSVLKTELFKIVFLFHLKRGEHLSHSVSKFAKTMEFVAPNTWPELRQFVDSPLRNSLAHGTYAIVNDKVFLYDDATLLPIAKLELIEILARLKFEDVLFQCLVNLIRDKTNEGFFLIECQKA